VQELAADYAIDFAMRLERSGRARRYVISGRATHPEGVLGVSGLRPMPENIVGVKAVNCGSLKSNMTLLEFGLADEPGLNRRFVHLPKIGLMHICSKASTRKGGDGTMALHLHESALTQSMMQLASIGMAQATPGHQLQQSSG
jgi:hypothetical protein